MIFISFSSRPKRATISDMRFQISHLKSRCIMPLYCFRPTSPMSAQTSSPERPRLWAMGISRLHDLFYDIADEYGGRADLRVVPLGFEDAVEEINASGEARPDVVVTG